MRKVRIENPHLLDLIAFLEKAAKDNDAKVWATVAEALSKTRKRRAAVNLSQISRRTEKSQVVAVAGKVLGSGALDHPVTVAAFMFSNTASRKIKSARGKCLTFPELVKKNPQGSGVKIVG